MERLVYIRAFDRENRLLYNGKAIGFALNNDNKVHIDGLFRAFGPVVTYNDMMVLSDGSGSSNVSFTPGDQVKVQSLSPPAGAVTPASDPWSSLLGFHTDAQRKVSFFKRCSRQILEIIRGITVDAGLRTKAD